MEINKILSFSLCTNGDPFETSSQHTTQIISMQKKSLVIGFLIVRYDIFKKVEVWHMIIWLWKYYEAIYLLLIEFLIAITFFASSQADCNLLLYKHL